MRIFPVLGWMLIPGCWALTGPGTVRGPAGGSVTVLCSYDRGYESYKKYWCWPGSWARCFNGVYIAESSGTEAEVKRDRVSLRDNHRLRSFTVTVENLTPADAGTYQCGIDRTGLDLVHNVEVIVTPGTSLRCSER
ncbi:CMRF35-like molecule 5 [Emydura macquarii macquarii]|uniref:CMRF35-like molecule 5 n=1 Tax=Emydura macquarii macquarii TaxID=1129001 RepID=UPI00352ADE9F